MLALSIAPGVAVIPVGWAITAAQSMAAAASFALLVGSAVLLSRRRTIWQTTLVSAWWWAVAALCAWCGIEMAGAVGAMNPRDSEALKLAGATLTLCPLIALLGAKRPQDRAWNFVVLSLWGILALPAAEAFFLHRGQHVQVGQIRGTFLWILILLGPVNFVPTRYWLASLLLAGGQIVALALFLPLVRTALIPQPQVLGALLAAAALAAAWLSSRRSNIVAGRYSRLWLDFRDTFGLFWGLRVQERINAAARQQGLDVALRWKGLCTESGEPLDELDSRREARLRVVMKGLLRRYVTRRWIAERIVAE